MKKPAIEFRQFDLKMYLLTLSIEELVENTYVNVFNSETSEGYQRPLDPNHYKKITKYLKSEDSPILPPTILTAIDEEKIVFESNYLYIEDKLRLVDGQHRIEGFKYLKKVAYERYEELKDMEMPVTVMAIENKKEIYEVNTFIDINSKGKRVSTDLAIRLRDSIRNQVQMYKTKSDLIESISTKTALSINNDNNLSIWYDSIKVSPEVKGKIISINAFCRSLFPIIDKMLEVKGIDFTNVNNETLNTLVKETSDLVNLTWEIVENKWSECFSKYSPRFNKNYNLQKGTGTYSIHLLMNQCLEECNGNIEDSLKQFKTTIGNSIVKSSDWITGGIFSGYSSQSGFKYIAEQIKNK